MKNKIAIRLLKKSSGFKVLEATGNSGEALHAHKVNTEAILLVKTGNIVYQTSEKEIALTSGEVHFIPPEEIHEVHCKTTAQFLLILPEFSKMRFEK